MEITLSAENFQKLSQPTKNEIIQQLLGESTKHLTCTEEGTEGPAELTTYLMKKFMEGVSETTKGLLKIFAVNEGRASYAQLLEQCDYDDWRKLRGFFSGVTRRVRRIIQDDEAVLLEWDEDSATYDDDGELLDGEYFMSALSIDSLKKYFKL